MLKILQAGFQQLLRTFRCISWVYKRLRNHILNCQHTLHHEESKEIPEKHLLLLHWLCTLKLLTVWITTNWKILKDMGIPDYLTCLLRILYAGQEAIVRTVHGTTDWFKIGKGVCQSYILSLCLFTEKAMAPHSSTLAWKIPWTEEPGRLQSMGSLGVGHDCVTFK